MTYSPKAAGRGSWAALVAAAVTVVLWASAFVAIRGSGAAYPPGALALLRLLCGSAVLVPISLVRRAGWPARAAWPGIVWSGLLWFGLYMVVLNWGERKVDAGTAAMVVNIGPLLIALMSSRLLGDSISRPLLAGMAISFAGAIVVGVSTSDGGHASVAGVLLCLLAALAYAAGVVAQKPALAHASPLQVTTFGCLIATIACLPFTGSLLHAARHAPWSATLGVVYLGVFPTALAFTTWAFALARTTASRMGATTYVVPALVVLMSWLALGEVPGVLTLAGGVLCLLGVAVSRRRPAVVSAAASDPAPPTAPDARSGGSFDAESDPRSGGSFDAESEAASGAVPDTSTRRGGA
jgi:drug/metabolite transporter (DMT)-like permease